MHNTKRSEVVFSDECAAHGRRWSLDVVFWSNERPDSVEEPEHDSARGMTWDGASLKTQLIITHASKRLGVLLRNLGIEDVWFQEVEAMANCAVAVNEHLS